MDAAPLGGLSRTIDALDGKRAGPVGVASLPLCSPGERVMVPWVFCSSAASAVMATEDTISPIKANDRTKIIIVFFDIFFPPN
jgi:hypothetical protein